MNQRQSQKSQSRQRIVHSAVRLLRQYGLTGASVAEVMAGAGLTVGGFYAHFPSKEELAEEAVHQGLQERRRLFLERSRRESRDGWEWRLRSALAAYFSEEHRDDAEGRCPMPMAAVDAAGSGTAAAAFVEEMAHMAKAFETGTDPAATPAPREAALGSLALMVGGMILANAAKGTALSGEILQAAQRFGDAGLRALAGGERP
jgi:TetR/AcrR family transcriptional repressor of nem operon